MENTTTATTNTVGDGAEVAVAVQAGEVGQVVAGPQFTGDHMSVQYIERGEFRDVVMHFGGHRS